MHDRTAIWRLAPCDSKANFIAQKPLQLNYLRHAFLQPPSEPDPHRTVVPGDDTHAGHKRMSSSAQGSTYTVMSRWRPHQQKIVRVTSKMNMMTVR